MAVQTSDAEVQVRHLYVVIGVLLVAMFPAALDQTVLSTALPTIGSELGGGLGHESWIICSYLLAMIASVVLWGRVGDRLGRKPLFIAALAIFLIGSLLCGLAWNLSSLNTFRAVQGVGAGGVVVLTQAIAGDLAPPRDRGRYLGMFGALFAVASIAGPLFGGFFVDHLSWRWIMFLNLPTTVTLIALAAIVLPTAAGGERRHIDYLGPALMTGSVGMAMLTAAGVIQHGWTLPQAIGTGSVAVALGIGWGLTQRRAEDPTLPPRLFRNPAFSIGSAIEFVAGFVMFGSLIYVPVFLQVVAGVSPTASGVRLLPMILGVLVMAIVSGHLISRTGKYKALLTIGMALATLGLILCSRLDAATRPLVISLALGLLGSGLGLVVQVPIIAVQNTVPYRDLGVATSGVTLFRAIGALMGITVFSATLGHHLTARMAQAVRNVQLLPGLDDVALRRDPRLLSHLPPPIRARFAEAFEHSFHTMFLWSIPIALAGLALALLLRGTAARTTANVQDLGEAVGGAPTVRSSRHEIERQLSELLRANADTTEKVEQTYSELGAHAGSDYPPGALWALCRVARAGTIPADTLSRRAGITPEDQRPFINRLVADGLMTRTNGNLTITKAGQALTERLREAMQRMFLKFLAGWSTNDFPQLSEHLTHLSRQFLGDDDQQQILKPT